MNPILPQASRDLYLVVRFSESVLRRLLCSVCAMIYCPDQD